MTPKLEALVERLSDCRDISSLQSSLLAADLEACDVADYIRFDRDGYSRNREKIASDSYNVEVDGVLVRRNLCRQYLVHCDTYKLKESNYGTC